MSQQKRSPLGSVRMVEPGKYHVRVSAGRDVNGKRVELSETVYGTERDAELARARLLLRAGKGGSHLRRMTVYEYIAGAYLPGKTDLRPSTRTEYERLVATHVRTHFGDLPLGGLIAHTIRQRLDLIDAPGARLKVYTLLRSAMKAAVIGGFIDADPMPAVPRPKVPRKSAIAATADVYDLDEVRALLDYFHGDPIEPAVILGVFAGLRRSEIAALSWLDIRFTDGGADVIVRRGYHGRGNFEDPKSSRSRRVVLLPSWAAARLLEIRGPHDLHAPVLTGGDGERLSPQSITQRWRLMFGRRGSRRRAAPVRYLPMKNLRHTHATLMLASGVDVVDVSRRLGHSSVSVTDEFYLRPGRDADSRAVDAFDAAFDRPADFRTFPQRHA